MRVLALFLVLSYCGAGFTQQSNPSQTSQPLPELLQHESSMTAALFDLRWPPHEMSESPRYKKIAEATSDTVTGLTTRELSNATIEAVFHSLDPKTLFLYKDGTAPFRILQWEGEKSILIEGVCLDQVFNTLQTNDRTRASRVLSKLIPQLSAMADSIRSNSAIGGVGVMVTYGSHDFVEDDPVHAETLTILLPVSLMLQFRQGTVTEDQLFEKGIFFVSAVSGTKRVKLSPIS